MPQADDNAASIQPVVLVGGRSRRFGRDKLRELVDGDMLVDRSIGALRSVFGPRVAIVGECDPDVAARGDRVLEDAHPGAGPIGGVLSALRVVGMDVFVLPGDLLAIDSSAIRALIDARGAAGSEICSIIARTDRPEPCIGIYRFGAARWLERAIAGSNHGLLASIPDRMRLEVQLAPRPEIVNVNHPEDLAGARDSDRSRSSRPDHLER